MENKNWIFLVAAIVIVAGIAYYLSFRHIPECQGFECFQDNMRKCEKASYISEEPEASWRYSIKGTESDECVVNVRLLQAKAGDLGIDQLVGYDMDCSYPRGFTAYPEKDLDKCHGRLKEEMQNIIIKKLHTYIIENLGELDENLKSATK